MKMLLVIHILVKYNGFIVVCHDRDSLPMAMKTAYTLRVVTRMDYIINAINVKDVNVQIN